MSKDDIRNPFEVLGINKESSIGDVKKAYFQQVRQFSPEKHGEKFKQIRKAYDLLKDPSKRLEAEVFHFVTPLAEADSETKDDIEVATKEIEITDEALLLWIENEYTELHKTDFKSDFNEVD